MKRFLTIVCLGLLGLVIAGCAVWGTLALNYSGPKDDVIRNALAAAFAIGSLGALVALAFPRWRWRALSGYVLLFALLMFWWSGIEPSNDRTWQTDVAVLPDAIIEGDVVTVRNIRNFTYRSEFDYTPAYYDKRFDLAKLEGVDLVAVYWMGPAIAHIFVSFAFAGGDHLAISIEARNEKGEGYSTVKGFFRQNELSYIVADERDVVRLRTNYRQNPPEDTYIYRVKGDAASNKRLFLEYMNKIHALTTKPEFYNTLTTNCTTNIWLHTLVNTGHVPFSWKILASGYVPQYLYEQGRLDTSVPFAELQRRAHVNPKAKTADVANFSRLIRSGEIAAPVGEAATSAPGLR